MNEKTKYLLAKIEEKEKEIEDLGDEIYELRVAILEIEGGCPHCDNGHYPHCQITSP